MRNAAKCCEMLRIFLRFALKHNVHKVLTPAKNTTPNTKNLQLNDSGLKTGLFIVDLRINETLQIGAVRNADRIWVSTPQNRIISVNLGEPQAR